MMSYIKKVHDKPRLYYYLEYGRHHARLHRRRRAYAPTSNTASHDYHQTHTHRFPFVSYMGMELHLAALRAAEALLKTFQQEN